MDEMIEELWEKYSDDYDIRKTEFKQAIQTACQAQRNACIGAVECMVSKQVVDKIRNAEITKEDYE